MTLAKERQKIARQLSTLKESGGTDLYPALQEASRVLQAMKASKKHVIILSDGLTQEANFPNPPAFHAGSRDNGIHRVCWQ